MNRHEAFMREAILEAKKAEAMGEVPIGAIVVKAGKIVGRGFNQRETGKRAIAHAEILAIEDACSQLGGWRLVDCDLYVTLEPCLMCAGAIYQARVVNVYYGAADPKAGAFGSLYHIHEDHRLNHMVHVEKGILEDECSGLLKAFFKHLRATK